MSGTEQAATRRVWRNVVFRRRPPENWETGYTYLQNPDAIWDGGARGGRLREKNGRFYLGTIKDGGRSFERAAHLSINRRLKDLADALRLVREFEDEVAMFGGIPDASIPR